MKISWKIFVLIFGIIIVIPCLINFILAYRVPSGIYVVGENKDWLAFWGAYIASIGSFIIIYQTYKNHNDLKMLQINTLEYSSEQKKIDDLRIQLVDNCHTVDKHTFIHAMECYMRDEFDKAYEILVNLNKSILHQEYKTLLYMHKENLSAFEADYILFLRNVGEQFACLAGDMQFLVALSIDFPKKV